MSTLDDAISAHLAHPAGAGFDPLTDSLAEQDLMATQSAALDEAPRLREGWETEPVRVPHAWGVYVVTFLVGLLSFALSGCASTVPREPSPQVWASCPPLSPPPKRNDADAQTRRIAELEGWYGACREAALAPPRPRVPVGSL